MGLDIYLYRYDNYTETERKEKEYNDYSEKAWAEAGEYDELTQEQKDAVSDKVSAFAESLGLDKYGDDKTGKECVEIVSIKYPDHYFKIGYFRSSYNGGGINHILVNMGLPRLDKIFEIDSDDYVIQPDWVKVKSNLQKLLEDFKAKPAYRVHNISNNIFRSESGPTNEKEALDVFLAEIEKNKTSTFDEGYSNINGEFNIKTPMKVLGLIPGKEELFGTHDCVYLVTQGENEWYEQAIEIMIDTCDYVLAQDNINQYYLHWSG